MRSGVIGCFIFIFFLPVYAKAQADKKHINEAIVVKAMMERYHYSPQVFDNVFSEKIFDDFIKSLDRYRLLFTRQDVDRLSAYRAKIDDELNNKSTAFFNLTMQLFKVRLLKTDSIITRLLQKPFDFTVKETLLYPPDSSSFAGNEKEFEEKWNKWLKYEMLHRLMDKKIADSSLITAAVMKQEAAVREIVKKIEQRRIKRILSYPQGYDAYVAMLFCNSIAACYDPHSTFLPLTQKENFEGDVSASPYSFGLTLDENKNGDVIISHIVPGSPGWRSGELNKEDVLVQMKWQNKNPVDLEGADVEEVGGMFAEQNHDKLQLTVRKTNGEEKIVMLIKEKLKDEESIVKGFLLKGEKNIGYISLPGFYGEWGSSESSSCAGDVAKEIVKLSKLSKEKIEGLILDMRNNGGGSLQEALDMAGIFIDEGILSFTKGRSEKPIAMKDVNRGTIYDGPLLVLVNRSSASATELLSGALQDYNRAVIVGSSTFGKATAQVVLPADTLFNPFTARTIANRNSENAYIKITIEKLYRPTGKTNQFTGVNPDITLPDIYNEINYSEAMLPHAILPDSVKRAFYFTPLKALPVAELAAKSVERVKKDKRFDTVKKYCSMIIKRYYGKTTDIPLDRQQYEAEVKKYHVQWDQYKMVAEGEKTDLYTVENTEFDKPVIQADAYKSEINDNQIKNISKDIYISESFN
ncbi:MAG: carboxy terminal-processing peptidase, partial [Bacteroidia bacterium]